MDRGRGSLASGWTRNPGKRGGGREPRGAPCRRHPATSYLSSMPSPVDPEKILSDAIDLIADEREQEAEEMLNAFVAALKGAMNGSDADAQRYYWWGKALSLQDEW